MGTAVDNDNRGAARDERGAEATLGRLRKLLAESETRFRQLAEGLPHLVFTCDAQGGCDFICERWREYTGLALETSFGFRWIEQVHPDDREHALSVWAAALRDGTDFHLDLRIRRYDGAYRWFDARVRALRDEQGRVVRWYGSHTDVHELRERRKALEHDQEQLRRILATAPGVSVCLRATPDGRLTMPFASPGLRELSGFGPESLQGDLGPALARVHPDDLASVQRAIEESSRTLSPWRGEYRFLHPSRGELWIEAQFLPTREADGCVQWIGFLRDFSERRRGEESLKRMQSQLVTALDASGMGLLIWDVPFDQLWMDDALLKLLGTPRDQLSGRIRDITVRTHPDDARRVDELLSKLSREARDQDFDYRIVRPDGTSRWLSVRARPERDGTGRVARVTALYLDVTMQKRAFDAQLRSQKLEALGTLAGGIAHDFNNILQAIVGNTALALRTLPAHHEARSFLDGIGVATGRASDLVRRILAFSHGEEQEQMTIALDAAVDEALKLVRATLPAQIAIHAEHCKPSPSVVADATQIHQVIVNLATNAAHAIGPGGGHIHVRSAHVTIDREGREHAAAALPPGPYALLQVTDSGHGMDQETMARIFDPFFTTKPVGQGTGLGLSVVHGVMKSCGGAVTVTSELGQGTRFCLYFPLASAPPSPSRPAAGPRTSGGGARVMFVDDEEILVVLGLHILESLGYVATGFSTPSEALGAFVAAPEAFDAIVTDVSMPGMSGFDLAARMRAVRGDVPVLMMSGYVGPDELARAEQLGGADLLLKPVSIEDLGRALSRLVGVRRGNGLRTT